MKKWMALVCVLCCLMGMARAENGSWNHEAWYQVMDALAGDEANPVPAEYQIAVKQNELRSPEADKEESNWANILLLSTDSPEGEPNYGRTDAMLVCRVNMKTGNIYLLSLPQDAMVQPAQLPESVALRFVNCFGGPLLTAKTVNEALGLQINRYCAVRMDSFVSIVDALGGVEIDLSEDEAQALELSAGVASLNGAQALEYVKLRQEGSGTERARTLLQAIVAQTLRGNSINGVLTLMNLLLPAVNTNLTLDDLINLAFAVFAQETPGSFETKGLSVEEGAMLNAEAAAECRAFLYPDGE